MCGVNHESIITEIVVEAVKNEKFFENMTTEEKIKSVAELYKALRHEIIEHE
jgi:ribosomal protein S21